ncbi:MAG: hydrogenase iron-sulfur subunit [Thermoflexales bacterium]|nr:hydrogenase iron-sulfur subunit [Thermoflexales bacterium]
MPQSVIDNRKSQIANSKLGTRNSELRLGVFICDCGGQIARVVDTQALRQQAAALPSVVYAACDAYPCSPDGQARLRAAITHQQLDRVLVAGCAPRLVGKLFRQAAQAAGLDGSCVQVANIREHCAYVHAGDGAAATDKAASLVEMGVANLAAASLASSHTGRIVKSALVVGGELSGLAAALALADNDIAVTLVERADRLGGSPRELAASLAEKAAAHPHIHVLLGAHLAGVTGRPGDYHARIVRDDQGVTVAAGALLVASGARAAGADGRPAPQDDVGVGQVAALLDLPQDEAGFMIELRVRLRPGQYADDGVYVLGSAHQPGDAASTLLQSYVTGARALRFLSQPALTVQTPAARVEAALCTGCGNCVPVCPAHAISLDKREDAPLPSGTLSLAGVDALRCTGCGNCLVVCPPKAITLPGGGDAEILAQISAALARPAGRIVALACEWSAYAAADVAGARRLSYPPGVRIIRLNCSARFDPYHILWAFLNGAQGVFLGACPPGECHHGDGNRYAAQRVEALKGQLAEHGIDPRRLRLEFLAGDDGEGFARAVTEFCGAISTGATHL